MRLQQYLARSGVTSRRKAEDLIRAGRVSINNKVAQLGAVVEERDVVRLDGERVRLPNKSVVIALHKPKGFTTTHEDDHAEKLVYQLVPEHPGLHSVGRLDKDTEGLLLLTNDGNLTQRLTHPSNEVPKLYRVWSKRGRLNAAECKLLTDGLMLSDGFAKAMEAIPTKEGAKLVLTEGRKREVRRMLGKIGHPVEKLVRLAVGVIELGVLQTGEYRYLEPEEVRLLMDNVAPPKLRKPTPAAKQRRAFKGEETSEKPSRPTGRPSAASGSKPGAKPRRESGKSPQRPARSSQPQTGAALSEANKARIAKTLQRLKAEDEAEIPQSASRRAGRSGKGGAVRAAKPDSPKPARANPEPSRKPRPVVTKPQAGGRKSEEARGTQRPDSKPRRAEGGARATQPQRSETQPPRRPKTEKAPHFAKDARGSAKSKPQAPARGSSPKPSKPSKPISQKANPTVKSGDERVRGGQGQGANQRGANKGANRRTGPKNRK